MVERIALAAVGQTAAQTFPGVHVAADWDSIAFQLVVESIGAGPSITWKIQGSIDDLTVLDGAASWYDVGYITDSSDQLAQSARTRTVVGADIQWLANPVARRFHRFRLSALSVTNTTYHADMFLIRS